LIGRELTLFEDPSKSNQDTKFYIGRISCDSVLEGSKMNLHSLVLETSIEIGHGNRVKIDFGGLVAKGIQLELFPGIIVCVEASNPLGSCLCVVKILEFPKLNPPTTNGEDYISFYPDGRKQDLSIIFASGPFSLNDSLEYEPLEELIDVVVKDPPNLLLLMGPFVDIDHPFFNPTEITEIDLTFEEVFRLKFASKIEKLKKMMPELQIVLVPSQREATLEWVAYPQPPIGSSIRDHDHIEKLQQLGLMNKNGDIWANLFPNPVQFTCNEVVIGLSNFDTIRDMIRLGLSITPSQNANTSENSEQKIVPRDKFYNCFTHILGHRHFYPVFPPTAGACIDSTRALGSQPQDPCVLQVRPDVLIMPSCLQFFIKNVDDCVCINPGFLVKGSTGGTFCKIKVHPLQKEGMSSNDVFENCISERSKVEIIKL
jgi:DNA polymerase alpha subunit B